MDGFVEEMGIRGDSNLPSREDAVSTLKAATNTVKRSVLAELLSACLVNEDYDRKQVAFVEDISKSLGVPHEYLEKTENWVKRMLHLAKEGQELVAGL